MKIRKIFILIAFAVALFKGIDLQAQVAVTLNVATAGTLSTLIDSSQKNLITNLTLTGNLNGTDIRYIREMAGMDVYGNATSGMLSALDLSGANIVSGGSSYYDESSSSSSSFTVINTISSKMFINCTELTSITLPNSVISIESSAFYGCTGLTSVTIPNSVTSIGDHAFYGCTGLTLVTMPNSVITIYSFAFSGCTKLPSVTIPNSVTSIWDSAFSGCTGLTSVTIPNSVTSIWSSAFSGCTGLTSVTIPDSVTSIGIYAFSGCTGLTSVSIGSGLTSIWNSVFSNCTKLISVTIGSGVTFIWDTAFSGCTGLTQFIVDSNNSKYSSLDGVLLSKDGTSFIAFPNGKSTQYIISSIVTSIHGSAFKGCTGLTSVTIPNSVTSIGSAAFSGCTGLTSVTIGSGDISIVDEAFSGCTGLTSVTIGSGVISIVDEAFSGCTGLTSVTIPDSVTSIGSAAFSGCTGLTEIHCQRITPPTIRRSAFTNVNKSTCKLYVPDGSSDLYSVADVWEDFTNIIEEDVTAVNEIKTNNVIIYTEQNDIVVKGASVGEIISVYTTMGNLVQTIKATDDVRINVPSNQIYLVKIADKTFKVAL